LMVGMGIPLSRVPDVRRFYGKDPEGPESIDFIEEEYVYPTSHVCAARITAENPDDGFRPTSGKIERVRFQSNPSMWGYFSVGANGKIHEFADSQFGHIFAKGANREQARKIMQLGLRQMNITGEIRNPVEYLVELADTEAFKNNTIDTAWLDGLIAAGRDAATQTEWAEAVFYAACFRAHEFAKEEGAKILDGINRGQLPLKADLTKLRSFPVEVAYEGVKYNWQCVRTSDDSFAMTVGDTTIDCKIREQADGALYVSRGDRVARVAGVEEPLGLRMTMDFRSDTGTSTNTVVFPNLRDPSELRSEFNGKLVRYLVPDGESVGKDEPYVELEAMKMIMSVRADEAGKITQSLAPGAIVAPGQLLANLELADPSSVQTVKTFSGEYPLKLDAVGDNTVETIEETLTAQLSGYAISPNVASADGGNQSLVQSLFSIDPDAGIGVMSRLLACFLQNESHFAGLIGGDETQLIAKFVGETTDLFSKVVAHNSLPDSVATVAAMLRTLRSRMRELDGSARMDLPDDLVASIKLIAALPGDGGYNEIALLARGLVDEVELVGGVSTSIDRRKEEIKGVLADAPRKDMKKLAEEGELKHTMTSLVSLIVEDGNDVNDKALELYLRRLNFAYFLADFETVKSDPNKPRSDPGMTWGMMYDFDYPGAGKASRQGCALVVKSLSDLEKSWPAEVKRAQELQIIVADASLTLDDSTRESLLAPIKGKLDEIGCEELFVTVAQDNDRPLFVHYKAPTWAEIKLSRNMRPSYDVVLELCAVTQDFEEVSLINTTRRTALFLGSNNQAESLLVRSTSNDPVSLTNLEQMVYDRFQECMDNVERAMLDPAIAKKRAPPGTNIFFHVTKPVTGCTAQDAKTLRVLLDRCIKKDLLSDNAERLVRLNMEKVEVKLWVAGAEGEPWVPVRISASADQGWECTALKGISELKRGRASEWVDVETGEVRKSLSAVTALETKLIKKRSTARRANSTYVFDFLGLFRNSLVQQWVGKSGDFTVPEGVFSAKELVLEDGKLVEVDRAIGENNVGMVAWLCTMKTPEYPEGREMVLIGSDVTVKAGSFGTVEDEVFCQASMLARNKGIPRIYIACNSGARLGAVEELKPLINVAWVNPDDFQKGFEYLYITDAAKKDLPSDAVQSHPITVDGETRHVLDAIVGLDLKSIQGGIGVENLQGSGLIAGETSRAYDETFTLSYVTGRSVGIGAYLNRLGQRNIQKVKGPMILTGFDALNKLLGQQVYTTQDQLGGPYIMAPNGVTHELVNNDQSGVDSILRWMSFVPKDVYSAPPLLATNDPVTREVEFMPTKTPYDPRHMLAGARVDGEWKPGFCDEGSFKEYLEGWGKTVVVGRGRVGGLPVGIVAVETRSVERVIPADPATRDSRAIVEAQAGQVWFPDSAFKTAQAIRDFNRAENLPLIIFANWRGFSGGTRDMFAEILKYGAMIVDALVEYKHPVTIYIPPNGELRGGAWVVLDPTLNPENMEMYADEEARGGILEPAGASGILWKQQQINDMMHRSDPKLQELDAKAESGQDVSAEIAAREKLLMPLFSQVAVEFCDLHDKAGRMEKMGAIREALTWRTSRAYLHWRIRRRLAETAVAKQLRAAAPSVAADRVKAFLDGLRAEAGIDNDQAVAEWFEANTELVDRRVAEMKESLSADEMFKTFSSLSSEKQSEVLRDLDGFARVQAATQQ